MFLKYAAFPFNNQQLKRMDVVKHLGNYIDKTNRDTNYCSGEYRRDTGACPPPPPEMLKVE